MMARCASLRAVHVVLEELPEPISTALFADHAALAALGLCVGALPRWAHNESADLPNASELLGIVQVLACVRGGPSRLVSMGAVPALTPILKEERLDRLVYVPLSPNRKVLRPDVRGQAASVLLLLASAKGASTASCMSRSVRIAVLRPDVRGQAASVLLLLASAKGSAGREASAQQLHAQVPLLAARMITSPPRTAWLGLRPIGR
jgi:hypothetical protein